jgi:hypothetical protein
MDRHEVMSEGAERTYSRERTSGRFRALVAGVAVAVGVVGVGARAQASEEGHWKKFTVHFGAVNADFQPIETDCDPAAPAACVSVGKYPSYGLTGDLVGTAVQANVGAFAGTLVTARGVGVYTGSVAGCGSGTFVFTNNFKYDTATGEFIEDSYSIERGTGTGDFVGITGGPWVDGVGPVRCHVD